MVDDSLVHVAMAVAGPTRIAVEDEAIWHRIGARLPDAFDVTDVSRYDTRHVEIYASARKHGIHDLDINHAVEYALASGEQDDGKVLYLGPIGPGTCSELSRCCVTTARSS